MKNALLEALATAVRDLLGLVLRLVGLLARTASGLLTVLWVLCLACAGLTLFLGGITWLLAPHAHVGRLVHLAAVLGGGGLAVYLVQHFGLALAGSRLAPGGRGAGPLSPPGQRQG